MKKKRKLGICVVCKVRRGRYAAGPACEPCRSRVTAEKTAKELGVENPRFAGWREQIDAFNKMAKAGMTLTQIAEEMGVNASSLSSTLSRRARALGVKRLTTRKKGPLPQTMKAATPATNPRNEHGGGKYGVTGCWCKKCKPVKLAARAEQNEAYSLRKKEAKQNKQMPS